MKHIPLSQFIFSVGSTSILALTLAMSPISIDYTLEKGFSMTSPIALADGDGDDVGDDFSDADSGGVKWSCFSEQVCG